MEPPTPHACRVLSVAGVLRCIQPDHWWQPATDGTAANAQIRPDLKLVAP